MSEKRQQETIIDFEEDKEPKEWQKLFKGCLGIAWTPSALKTPQSQ